MKLDAGLAIFDLGNTLVDYHRGPVSEVEKDYLGLINMQGFLSRIGCNIGLDELVNDFYKPWLGDLKKRKSQNCEFDIREYLPSKCKEMLQTNYVFDALMLAFFEPCTRFAEKIHGVQRTLEDLKEKGFTLAIVSNTPVPGICHKKTLSSLGLSGYFSETFFSYDNGRRKPNESYLRDVIKECGATPESTVCIGDSVSADIEPAISIGAKAIHYSRKKDFIDFGDSAEGYIEIGAYSQLAMAISTYFNS